jgi:hypothetical protein
MSTRTWLMHYNVYVDTVNVS